MQAAAVPLCQPDNLTQLQAQVEKNVRFVWRFMMMPLLFGLIGASIVFRTLTQSSIPKACAIVIAGEHGACPHRPFELQGVPCSPSCLPPHARLPLNWSQLQQICAQHPCCAGHCSRPQTCSTIQHAQDDRGLGCLPQMSWLPTVCISAALPPTSLCLGWEV